jgi:hypothetical protein
MLYQQVMADLSELLNIQFDPSRLMMNQSDGEGGGAGFAKRMMNLSNLRQLRDPQTMARLAQSMAQQQQPQQAQDRQLFLPPPPPRFRGQQFNGGFPPQQRQRIPQQFIPPPFRGNSFDNFRPDNNGADRKSHFFIIRFV